MNQLNQQNQIVEKYSLLLVDIVAAMVAYLLAMGTRYGSVSVSMNFW